MYRALYRKYRPKVFSDVCGQPHIVRTLKNQIAENRISHAYLFTGSRGTGKTSCAKILAKAVNCMHPIDGNPCNECEICRVVDDETVLDVIEIDAASNNGVDDIRELRDNSAFAPTVAKYRVYIIDEVHMLSGAAFNALLKTLEEPPEHIIFILATTEVHKLPATILSRCQRFDFRRIPAEAIAERLEFVAENEDFTLTKEAALLIARLSDGAMRDALSLLDVCSASTTDITEKTVLDCAGLSGRQHLADLIYSCASGDSAAALNIIADLYSKAKDFGRLCAELVEYLRDIMLVKTLRKPEALLRCSSAELESLQKISESMTLESIIHAIDVFEAANERMHSGAARRTAVETAVIKLCCPTLDSSNDALVRRISILESGAVNVAPVAMPKKETAKPEKVAAQPEKAVAQPEPAPEAAVDEVVETVEAIKSDESVQVESQPEQVAQSESVTQSEVKFDRWNDVLTALGKIDPLMKAALGGSNAYISGDFMLIEITNSSFRDMINNDSRHRANLKKVIASVTGKPYKIGPYTPKAEPKTSTNDDDPLDKLALAIENS